MIYREMFIFGFLLLYLQESKQQNIGNGYQIITIGKPVLIKKQQTVQPRIVTPKQILNFNQQPSIATLIQLQMNQPIHRFGNSLSNPRLISKSFPISKIAIPIIGTEVSNTNSPNIIINPTPTALSLVSPPCNCDGSSTQVQPLSFPTQTQSSVSLSDISEKMSLLKSSLLLLPILLNLLKEKVSEARTELNCDGSETYGKIEPNCDAKSDNFPYDLPSIIMKNKEQFKLDSLTDMNTNHLDHVDGAKECSD